MKPPSSKQADALSIDYLSEVTLTWQRKQSAENLMQDNKVVFIAGLD